MGFMEYGMQFSEWMASSRDCLFWYFWFRDRGITAAVIRQDEKYGVFRRGRVERKSEHGGVRHVEPKTKLGGDISVVTSCNGYLPEELGR